MTTPVRLEFDAFYDDDSLRRTIGAREASLTRARKEGRLRFTRRGGKVLYLGAWVHAWLISDTNSAEAVAVVS